MLIPISVPTTSSLNTCNSVMPTLCLLLPGLHFHPAHLIKGSQGAGMMPPVWIRQNLHWAEGQHGLDGISSFPDSDPLLALIAWNTSPL